MRYLIILLATILLIINFILFVLPSAKVAVLFNTKGWDCFYFVEDDSFYHKFCVSNDGKDVLFVGSEEDFERLINIVISDLFSRDKIVPRQKRQKESGT